MLGDEVGHIRGVAIVKAHEAAANDIIKIDYFVV